ncbi:MAG: PIG-L family deacetylase [Microthrixaceae bacterium]
MTEPLRLLTVHAHPDDESSKGASTVARYAMEGIPSTLVCCTGGEAGSVLNPAMDTPEVNGNLAAVRREELAAATEIIGYDRVELLGYHDSGMPDSEDNARPDNFWNADMDEAIGRLVAVIRRDRPQVVVTYGDDQRHYAHPDHLRVHDITGPAFDRAGDPGWYPGTGEPWQPLKLYYTVWSRRRMVALHETFLRMGLESPFGEDWQARFEDTGQDDRITTRIPIRDYYEVRRRRCGRMPPRSIPRVRSGSGCRPRWRDVHPWDDYILARSLVPTSPPEDDLFAGVPGR